MIPIYSYENLCLLFMVKLESDVNLYQSIVNHCVLNGEAPSGYVLGQLEVAKAHLNNYRDLLNQIAEGDENLQLDMF